MIRVGLSKQGRRGDKGRVKKECWTGEKSRVGTSDKGRVKQEGLEWR